MDRSGFINQELKDVQKTLLSKVEGCEIIGCHQNLVSIKITKTPHRVLTVCIQFPQNYPDDILLVEIKSKVMSPALVNHIGQICDNELKKRVGDKQVMILLKFVRKFLDDNPLLPCRDELTKVKKELLEEDIDIMKMKQKQGTISVAVCKENYRLKFTVSVPDEYPTKSIEMTMSENNFPAVMAYYFISQAREFARQAVEPPLKKNPKAPPFQPSPHVFKVMKFLISCGKRYPVENCPLCGKQTLPNNPSEVVTDMKEDNYAERIYCGHLFHHGCLDKYMKTPPFEDGKKCPNCKQRIYHDKWNISPRLAEARWAHKEARQRELDEVVEFLS
ncbi:uncharacterized protein LOC100177726 [Ciona intestinalis]